MRHNLNISTNSDANPVFVEDVDNPARQPFVINLCNADKSGTACGGVANFFTVPSERRLVIEQVSGVCLSSDPTDSEVVAVTATVGGAGSTLTVLPEVPNAALGVGYIIPATQTKIYPDPGTEVSFNFPHGAVGTGTGVVCNAYLIGYTIRP